MSIPRDLWVTNVETGKQGPDQRHLQQWSRQPRAQRHRQPRHPDQPVRGGRLRELRRRWSTRWAVSRSNFAHPVIDRNSGLRIDTAGDRTSSTARWRWRTCGPGTTPRRSTAWNRSIPPRTSADRSASRTSSARCCQRWAVPATRHAGERGSAAAKGVRVDSELGFGDLVSLARQLGAADPATVVLPTASANKGGAAVLVAPRAPRPSRCSPSSARSRRLACRADIERPHILQPQLPTAPPSARPSSRRRCR